MSMLGIGLTCCGLVMVLIALRVPIGIALLAVSFGGVWSAIGFGAAWGIARAIPFDFIANWNFSAIPMFMLMGYVAATGGLTDGLFTALNILLRRMPGGLACAGIVASGMFAAASGSSVATSAAMAKIAVPEMLRHGYDKGLAAGSVATAGTLGSLIPPSILMIIFAIFTNTSIGGLFMAGFVPAAVSIVMYMTMIVVRVKLNPDLAPAVEGRPSRSEFFQALHTVWPLPTLMISVLGGIFAGVMTPTEAGAVGALVAILLAGLRGSLNWAMLSTAVREAAVGTSTVFLILVGASLFTSLMGLTGVPAAASGYMLTFGTDAITVIVIISIVYLILGMFLDATGVMLLTLPVFFPVLQSAGVDMIWFGVIAVKLLEIGMVTPPVGINGFVTGAVLRGTVPLTTVFRGSLWFVATDLVTLCLLISFPIITLWLPNTLL